MTTIAALRERFSFAPTAAAALVGVVLAGVTPSIIGWTAYLQVTAAPAAAVLVAIAVVDMRTLTLPNRLVAPLAGVALGQLAGSCLYGRPAASAAAAGAIVFTAYALMVLLGMCGAGDAKFAGAATLWAGLYVGLLAVYVLPVALIFAGGQIALSRLAGARTRRHPHGPAIAAATILLIVIGSLAT